jgi:pyruvate formate lyase activating enzyme
MEQGAVKTDMAACRRCGACADACPTGARELAGREIDTDSVVAELERDRPFYDESGGGVTFTGGEPLEQPGFLGSLLRACRQVGIRTAVDTSGAVPWEAVEAIVPSTDLFLYDLKLVDDSKHRRFTGASNRPVLDNLKRLCSSGCAVRLRIPLIPGINDSPQELGDLAECASGLSGLLGVDLLPFHAFGGSKYESLGRPYRMAGTRPLSGDRVTQIRRLFEARGLRVGIGG